MDKRIKFTYFYIQWNSKLVVKYPASEYNKTKLLLKYWDSEPLGIWFEYPKYTSAYEKLISKLERDGKVDTIYFDYGKPELKGNLYNE